MKISEAKFAESSTRVHQKPAEPIAGQILPDNPFKFIGKEKAAGSGLSLYDFGARWYNPATPAWTTPDPLAEKVLRLLAVCLLCGRSGESGGFFRKESQCAHKIFKAVRKAYKASKTAQKVTAGALALNEIYSYYDNFNTLSNSESSWAEKGLAAIDVLTGFGSEAKSLAKSLGFHGLLETSFRSFTYKKLSS